MADCFGVRRGGSTGGDLSGCLCDRAGCGVFAREGGNVKADEGQILVFSVFLLFFVILLVVGQSLVLFGRAREAERQRVEVFSRDVVDSATGFVNNIAASAYDLRKTLFDASGDVKGDYAKWRRVDGGWCDDDGNGTPNDGLGDRVVDQDAGVGCWKIVKGAEDTGNTGLAGKSIEFVRVNVEIRAGCTPGVDRLDTATGTLGGCSTGDYLELRYKRRSMFDYVLHYNDNDLPPRWKAGASITNVVFDATGTVDTDRDIIEGPIHTNKDHVLVCGTSASDVFTDTLVEVGTGSGTYKDHCGGGSSYGSLSNTGQVTVEGLVVDEGETGPGCDGSNANTDWLRDARRPAEANVAGYEHIVGDGRINLAEFSAGGADEFTDVVYATGDLRVTKGTVNRPVTLIAEGDIIIEGSDQKSGDGPIEFAATGDTDDRTNVLGFLAGCDIVIDYVMKELPSPVPTDYPLRPEEPYRSERPLYPENHWAKAHHAHHYVKETTESWGSSTTWCTYDFTNPITPSCASNESYSFNRFPCYKSGSSPQIEGTCDAKGYPGKTFQHTWWRGADHPSSTEQGITKSEFTIVADEYGKYLVAKGIYSAARGAWDASVGQYRQDLLDYNAVDDHCYDGDDDNGEGPGCASSAYAGCGCSRPDPGDTKYDVGAYTSSQVPYNTAMNAYKSSIRPSFTSSNTPQTWTGREINHTDVNLSGCTGADSCPFELPSVPLPPAPNRTKPFPIDSSHPCNTPPIEVTNAYFKAGYDVWEVYNWHDPAVKTYQAKCNIDGIKWNATVSENHAEYWVWVDWYPSAPTWPSGPHPVPASYPGGNPQDSSADDSGYCVSWDEWVYRDEVLTWNPLTPDTGNVPSATKNLSGGWASGSSLTPIENHTISDTANHGPDRPYKGGFHSDYKTGTNDLNEPPTLVTRVFDSSAEHLGHAVKHWNPNDYIMKNPTPKHELCDFMSFKLTNVAFLAPAGGVVADKWYLPHQAGSTKPTIEIIGSISTGYRGLFGRADSSGDLISGYRKIFKYPDASVEFSRGTTAWWPDIKLNYWAPQP